MGKFTNQFLLNQVVEWKDKYVEYQEISNFIKEQNKAPPESQLSKKDLVIKLHDMLDKSLKKVYMFFVTKERELYVRVNSRLYMRRGYATLNAKALKKELIELKNIMDFTIQISSYIRDNLQAIQKILKKIDKHFKNFNLTMSYSYVLEKMEEKTSDLKYIEKFKMINECMALLDDMRKELLDLYPLSAGNENVVVDAGNIPEGEKIGTEGLLAGSVNKPEEEEEKKEDTELKDVNAVEMANIILQKLDENDLIYEEISDVFREWTRILKFDQYFTDKVNMSKKIEDNSESSISSRLASMSKSNKWNINLTLAQKWYMALCFTMIIPDAYRMLKDDIGYGMSFSALIIGMTPLGGIIAMAFTKYFLDSSFKIPMIISAVLSVLGHVLYIVGIGVDSLTLCSISRLLIGFALNAIIHRRYLLEYIPKRKIGKYMLYFKMSYLSGLSCGPLLTLIMSFTPEHGSSKNPFPFTHYTSPSWIAFIGAIVMLIFVLAFYSEPTKSEFNVFAGDTNVSREASRGNSFLLESSMTNKESDALKEINDKLSQFNAENNYSDTNQVSQYVDELMDKELGPNGSIQKAFAAIIIEVFLANFIIMSFFCLTPLLFYEKLSSQGTKDEIIDRIIALSITIPLLLLVPLYFVNYFYISVKIDKRKYLIGLSILIGIIGICARIAIESVPVFTYLLIFLIICSYILEDTNIYFFTKMIPSDFEVICMHGDTFVHMAAYIGQMLGCFVCVLGRIYIDLKDRFHRFACWFLVIESLVVMLSAILYIILYRTFKDKAILRLIRGKDNRKIRRTEF
ncbi:MAG: hypothetical protein MJ252_17715 [archaeon]|nr:hypothetical protein [archaeon]